MSGVSNVNIHSDNVVGDITTLLQMILARMPTPDRTMSMRVVAPDGTNLLSSSAYSVMYTNGNSNTATGQAFWRLPEQWYFSNSGSQYLYDQIKVT